MFKASKWCPRRITPPVCRIHGFKDKRSEYMDFLSRSEYYTGRTKIISPPAFHYKLRTEIQLGLTAKQFFDAVQKEPLSGILPEEVSNGEIIEIDDGLKPFPCWYGDYDTPPDEKSSLLWLARQQGYSKAQLWQALREGDMLDPEGFLESCRVECANLPSAMAAVTFLVRMTLAQLLELNRCVQLQDRNGHFYDATQTPDCGCIIVSKDTMCGLFDPWAGGGVLEIQLEKAAQIPIRYIWSALPDGHGNGRYNVGNVYRMCDSAWQDIPASYNMQDELYFAKEPLI